MHVSQFTLPAPAKLNLYLHIVGQRPDGYHQLETVFQFLDFSDTIAFQENHSGAISLSVEAYDEVAASTESAKHVDSENTNKSLLPAADLAALQATPLQENLIYRAAELLLPYRRNKQLGVHLTLYKRLPMGGGVGGGSSNAATTLLGLNYLWDLQLSEQQLANIGLRLGADVPVFVHGKASFAEGVGEIFSTTFPAEKHYLVVHPQVAVSTAQIFTHPALPRNTKALHKPLENWQSGHNDCEKLVCSLYPQVASALQWLLKYAPSRMTGTGACVFGCFTTTVEAQKALRALPAEFRGFVATGVNQSPLHAALTQLP